MTDRDLQVAKAEHFRSLHHDARLLILANVWDPLGAHMIESLGFPAVATASAAVAWSQGRHDGEHLTFEDMHTVVERVARAVTLPVTADIERGYADTADGVREHVRRIIEAGAVGVNIEDSLDEGGALRPIDEQVERLRATRDAADDAGVPLVINARTDVWLGGVDGDDNEKLAETVVRARAYLEAGADCIYPLWLSDIDRLEALRDAIDGAPINVYAHAGAPPLKDLEGAGIARVSVGPGLLKVGLTAMRRVAEDLLNYGSYDGLTDGIMTTQDVGEILPPEN